MPLWINTKECIRGSLRECAVDAHRQFATQALLLLRARGPWGIVALGGERAAAARSTCSDPQQRTNDATHR
jgi:hypothetical protein